jgi:SAM-dependent methyltransferase
MKFDIILSNGVFHYFPNLDYAENTLKEILKVLKPGGKGVILDLNDIEKKEAYETYRRGKLELGEYERLYKDLKHLFFHKSWFEKFTNKYNLKYRIKDQSIPGYENSKFRFNFYFEKTNNFKSN